MDDIDPLFQVPAGEFVKIAIKVQYDGTGYHGWQIQKDPETIQGHLERVLEELFEKKIGLIGSGRTDSGVHALGQVAHFEISDCNIPVSQLWKALNRHLPRDIRVVASQEVDQEFHSRFSAINRQYLYQISTRPNVLNHRTHWYVRYRLDIQKLHELGELIRGVHDFSSFCYAGTVTENMVCDIGGAQWVIDDSQSLSFTLNGDRFLHHMVRMLVGSMVEVARGKWDLNRFVGLLNQPNRQSHTVTAPAHGLALMQVTYPESIQPAWEVDQG